MDGDLLMIESAHIAGKELSRQQMDDTSTRHAQIFVELCPRPRPTTGAAELLSALRRAQVPHGIATSGEKQGAAPALRALKLGRPSVIVDRSDARTAKPAPELFLKCQQRLKVDLKACFVIGDAVWDVLGDAELYRAGAFSRLPKSSRIARLPSASRDSTLMAR